MDSKRIIFRAHAIQRMFQRRVSFEDIDKILIDGVTIEEYPDDTPYPSRLVFGWQGVVHSMLWLLTTI